MNTNSLLRIAVRDEPGDDRRFVTEGMDAPIRFLMSHFSPSGTRWGATAPHCVLLNPSPDRGLFGISASGSFPLVTSIRPMPVTNMVLGDSLLRIAQPHSPAGDHTYNGSPETYKQGCVRQSAQGRGQRKACHGKNLFWAAAVIISSSVKTPAHTGFGLFRRAGGRFYREVRR